MKKIILTVIVLLMTAMAYGIDNPKFTVGDLVYLFNYDNSDDTMLAITNEPSKILAVKYVKDLGYVYRVQVYADRPSDEADWDTKWWIKEKYIHCW